MKDLITYIAKSIVDRPDQVEVAQIRGRNATILKLRVAPEDKGWVIGRRGRVANAMRSLLRVAASDTGRNAILEIE
ncbi:MAG: KH domain-containing protein [Chloroflexi bacterium]|nr:KH domain-containing protein [Chloroflexota bacterium]